MSLRGSLWTAAWVLGLVLVGIQFIQPWPRDNPPVDPASTIEANVNVPPHIRGMLNRACKNCHSHETVWPWYAWVAPASWLMARDVQNARRAVNFSDWTGGTGRKPAIAAAKLAAACENVKSGRMPMAGTPWLHPRVKPAPEEVLGFCAWAEKEGEALLEKRRKEAIEQSGSPGS
ncbi:MAG: heme-binding domain-containing protein [Bryobacter sp.]|jgi:hypothetical protein|nr:heme-binding domain-containing protein [Bryobacter sp.]